MNRFLRVFLERGKDRQFSARVVSYADDFVILSRGRAEAALVWTRRVMTAIGLSLNEAKTCIRNAREEHFDFLGYTFGPERYRKDGHWYLAAKPSKKSVERVREKVWALLRPGNQGTRADVVRNLNRLLRGWSNYFSYGTRLLAYRAVDNYVNERVRHFLRRRHKVPTRGTRRFDDRMIFGELRVLRLRTVHVGAKP